MALLLKDKKFRQFFHLELTQPKNGFMVSLVSYLRQAIRELNHQVNIKVFEKTGLQKDEQYLVVLLGILVDYHEILNMQVTSKVSLDDMMDKIDFIRLLSQKNNLIISN